MAPSRGTDSSLVISYLTLRATVGVLGILLPIVLSIGGMIIFHLHLQSSLSSYYYTGMRDVLIGTLWSIGFFLFAYRGYELEDEIAGRLACVFAVGVSLFPTAPDCTDCLYSHFAATAHGIFAALLFLTLSYFSLVLFTKTDPTKHPTREKLQRNAVYRVCGYIMLGCIVLTPLSLYVEPFKTVLERFKPVFWLEAIAIFAFGISWFTKGEAILKDQPTWSESQHFPRPQ
jgi:hypothetical protein